MRCPELNELPAPPAGKTGWPWTEEGIRETGERVEGRGPLPRVSIVSPSYNQGRFLEETIRSVLLQGYPDLEYIVIDGGSSDESVEIIRKYEPWLTYWVSEKDRGQCHAINKGFEHATGEVFGWMNSDDYFYPEALHELTSLRSREAECVGWAGACREVGDAGDPIKVVPAHAATQEEMSRWVLKDVGFHQPSCVFDGATFRKAGGMNENLTCFNDVDLWLRMRAHGAFAVTDRVVSSARIYPEANSQREFEGMAIESIAVTFGLGLRQSSLWHLARYTQRVKRDCLRRLTREDLLAVRSPDAVLSRFRWGEIVRHLFRRGLSKETR